VRVVAWPKRVMTVLDRRVLTLLLLASLPVWAVEPPDAEAARVARERAEIGAERERLEAQFAAEQARCAGRFVVTGCLEDVRERRRVALEGPRARALALDDAERRRRAATRREALAQRQLEAAARPPPSVGPLPGSALQVWVPEGPASVSTPGGAGLSAPAAAASAAAEAAAVQRAAAARQRAAAMRAEQARIEERQAERARRGKPSVPLPVPAASAPR
jgi:colicin import membrane protein